VCQLAIVTVVLEKDPASIFRVKQSKKNVHSLTSQELEYSSVLFSHLKPYFPSDVSPLGFWLACSCLISLRCAMFPIHLVIYYSNNV